MGRPMWLEHFEKVPIRSYESVHQEMVDRTKVHFLLEKWFVEEYASKF